MYRADRRTGWKRKTMRPFSETRLLHINSTGWTNFIPRSNWLVQNSFVLQHFKKEVTCIARQQALLFFRGSIAEVQNNRRLQEYNASYPHQIDAIYGCILTAKSNIPFDDKVNWVHSPPASHWPPICPPFVAKYCKTPGQYPLSCTFYGT